MDCHICLSVPHIIHLNRIIQDRDTHIATLGYLGFGWVRPSHAFRVNSVLVRLSCCPLYYLSRAALAYEYRTVAATVLTTRPTRWHAYVSCDTAQVFHNLRDVID